MATILQRRAVLVVGGGGSGPPANGPRLPPSVAATNTRPEDLRQTLKNMQQAAAEKGFDVRMMQLSGAAESSAWLDEVKSALASQSWDGFIIGNGIRGNPDFTMVFEQLVSIGREAAPTTPMGFNTHPLDILETIERMFQGQP